MGFWDTAFNIFLVVFALVFFVVGVWVIWDMGRMLFGDKRYTHDKELPEHIFRSYLEADDSSPEEGEEQYEEDVRGRIRDVW